MAIRPQTMRKADGMSEVKAASGNALPGWVNGWSYHKVAVRGAAGKEATGILKKNEFFLKEAGD